MQTEVEFYCCKILEFPLFVVKHLAANLWSQVGPQSKCDKWRPTRSKGQGLKRSKFLLSPHFFFLSLDHSSLRLHHLPSTAIAKVNFNLKLLSTQPSKFDSDRSNGSVSSSSTCGYQLIKVRVVFFVTSLN